MISNQPQSDKPGESHEQRPSSSTGETGGRMKEHMRSVAHDARQKGRSVIDRQKHQVAETLRHVSEALNRASQKLHEEHDDNVANFTDAVCERVEGVAEYVDRVEVSDMIDQVEHFARRQPQVFLGGMFLVGLAAARFLKASPPSQGHRQGQMSSGSMQHQGVTGTRGATPGLRGGLEHSNPGSSPGGMQGASTRQQGIGGPGSQSSGPGQSGPQATPPTGATFPSSSEPISGPRSAESSRGESGIGGSSRSQESRPGSASGSTSPQREKQHQSEQHKRHDHEGRGGES